MGLQSSQARLQAYRFTKMLINSIFYILGPYVFAGPGRVLYFPNFAGPGRLLDFQILRVLD